MVNQAETKVISQGDGKTTEFPFSFPYASIDDVHVLVYDVATDKETVLTGDYYVDATKGVVLYPGYAPGTAPATSEQPAALPEGKKLTIYRETPVTQETDLGEKYPLPLLEKMDDKLTMIVQEQTETLARTVTVPKSSDTSPDEIIQTLYDGRDLAVESASLAEKSAADAAACATAAEAAAKEANEGAALASSTLEELSLSAKYLGTRATAYSASKTYAPADVVMLADGSAWRCIKTSTGEDPRTSGKWVPVTTTTADTFEYDDNGDLMVRASPQVSSYWGLDENEDVYALEG